MPDKTRIQFNTFFVAKIGGGVKGLTPFLAMVLRVSVKPLIWVFFNTPIKGAENTRLTLFGWEIVAKMGHNAEKVLGLTP